MVQFLSIFFFLGFLQFLLGFPKVPVFLCHLVFDSVVRSAGDATALTWLIVRFAFTVTFLSTSSNTCLLIVAILIAM